MQDGATPHRTKEVFEAIYNVYGNRVIGLGTPNLLTEELSGHHTPQIWTPVNFSYGVTSLLFRKSNNNRRIGESY